jgi:hypothetical protein
MVRLEDGLFSCLSARSAQHRSTFSSIALLPVDRFVEPSDNVRSVDTDLTASGGDFSVATESCLADDTGYLSYVIWELTGPDDAWWYLVRPVLTTGPGSYDSG